MTPGMRPVSPVINLGVANPGLEDLDMERFQRLFLIAILAGVAAGLMLFLIHHWVVVPLIDQGEAFEQAAHLSMPGMDHGDEGWQPAPGFQRTALTALSTVLTGIGFSAILISIMTLSGRKLTAGSGVLWGFAGFVCFVLAPALGLPPLPPGAAVADLQARQVWWLCTVVATGAGLALGLSRSPAPLRIGGLLIIALPHLIGAPRPMDRDALPPELAFNFAVLAVASNLIFWLLLGSLCGWLWTRQNLDQTSADASASR